MGVFDKLYAVPFRLKFRSAKKKNQLIAVAFYFDQMLDYYVGQSLLAKFPNAVLIVKHKELQSELNELGVQSVVWPQYPKVVIMFRHQTKRFPVKEIVKIGLRHGPYHFKAFIAARKYNIFDRYYFSSAKDLEAAKLHGITIGDDGGYPKLDQLFDKAVEDHSDQKRKVILFSATYPQSGLSAKHLWIDQLKGLSEVYEIWVTLHPQTPEREKEAIRKLACVKYLGDENITPLLLQVDLLIADMSSIIAEFVALDRPVITFETKAGKRSQSKVIEQVKMISERISTGDQLEPAIKQAFLSPGEKSNARKQICETWIGAFDGMQTERTYEKINAFISMIQPESR